MPEQTQDKPKAEVIFRMEIGGKLVDMNIDQVNELYTELKKWFDKIKAIRDQIDKMLPKEQQEIVTIPSAWVDHTTSGSVPVVYSTYYNHVVSPELTTVYDAPTLLSNTIASVTTSKTEDNDDSKT